MQLELINSIATLTTAVVIVATAIAAIVQLRHLRASNQINAMLSIGEQIDTKEFREASARISELIQAMELPAYRMFEADMTRMQSPSTVTPAFRELRSTALLVGNTWEELGILVKQEIVDPSLFFDRYCGVISKHWQAMEGHIAFQRRVNDNDAVYENFEFLAVRSREWLAAHPSTYPRGVARLKLSCPWPVPASAAS